MNLVLRNSRSPFTVHNRIHILTNGVETFRAIIQALNEATHHIHMQYYIWRDDQIGRDIQRVLIEKARAGVEVRVIYDGVGSMDLRRSYIDELREAGVEIYPFLPVAFPVITSKLNYRNHLKIVVVDGKVAFMGGLNIGDEYLGKDPRMGFWRDTHLEVRGDAVALLQAIFLMDWDFVKGESHYRLQEEIYFPAHNVREKQFRTNCRQRTGLRVGGDHASVFYCCHVRDPVGTHHIAVLHPRRQHADGNQDSGFKWCGRQTDSSFPPASQDRVLGHDVVRARTAGSRCERLFV